MTAGRKCRLIIILISNDRVLIRIVTMRFTGTIRSLGWKNSKLIMNQQTENGYVYRLVLKIRVNNERMVRV